MDAQKAKQRSTFADVVMVVRRIHGILQSVHGPLSLISKLFCVSRHLRMRGVRAYIFVNFHMFCTEVLRIEAQKYAITSNFERVSATLSNQVG